MDGTIYTSGKASAVSLLPGYPVRGGLANCLFLAFVLARYVQVGARRDILASIRFEFLLGVVVIGMVVYQMVIRKRSLGNNRILLFSISLLFMVMIVETPFAADPNTARQIFLDRVIKFAFLTLFMVVLIESPRYLGMFLLAFLFLALFLLVAFQVPEAFHFLPLPIFDMPIIFP